MPIIAGRLRVGIIGCGLIAANHVSALRAAADTDVVAAADTDGARARDFARRHDVPLAYSDPEQLFTAGVHAVIVCTHRH